MAPVERQFTWLANWSFMDLFYVLFVSLLNSTFYLRTFVPSTKHTTTSILFSTSDMLNNYSFYYTQLRGCYVWSQPERPFYQTAYNWNTLNYYYYYSHWNKRYFISLYRLILNNFINLTLYLEYIYAREILVCTHNFIYYDNLSSNFSFMKI